MTRKALLSDDTTVEAEDAQVRRWREMASAEKGRLITSLCQTVDAFALAGIRHRHPGASTRECFLRFAILRLGPALACRAYPEASPLVDRQLSAQ
jgi:hypothetical protein